MTSKPNQMTENFALVKLLFCINVSRIRKNSLQKIVFKPIKAHFIEDTSSLLHQLLYLTTVEF